MEDSLWLELMILCLSLICLRFFYLVHKVTTSSATFPSAKRRLPAKTVICIGSGGHTTEMLELVKQLDTERYTPRHYILANSDTTSLGKVQSLETSRDHRIVAIPRSRSVGQSYFTSVVTTAYSTLYSVPILARIRPDLLLCNGPGTCVPLCVVAFVLKAAFVCDTKIVFVESFCRTKTFSLSGRILFYLADHILVQWPLLKSRCRRADYVGQLL
ncbi:hypothetical protein PPYR_14368 [Photinus pyralis]|uniref:UDP-N-acetylglucosamine transferase subunit ALG14 n=1 Tax=Photinus pyralis TaxID=7054 RepID=A0A1Y1NL64_PHOPY|nr:UDP-N-acetylglucosamine transferase subunit ALG14 homolog [Photinus pyralis]XP_031355814.1 UDP-N-acetylglucosamine transferase subunit ALG14 homolog [Photinus pyralis]KAB0792409.1 hypothetical protein PPYR_14368 [Photinus pyralis]